MVDLPSQGCWRYLLAGEPLAQAKKPWLGRHGRMRAAHCESDPQSALGLSSWRILSARRPHCFVLFGEAVSIACEAELQRRSAGEARELESAGKAPWPMALPPRACLACLAWPCPTRARLASGTGVRALAARFAAEKEKVGSKERSTVGMVTVQSFCRWPHSSRVSLNGFGH